MEMNAVQITKLEELLNYKKLGSVVELPPFAEDQPFIARLRRPSMLKMIESGKIPNSLITKANELFVKGGGYGQNVSDQNLLKDLFDVLEAIASEMFIEPSYKDLKGNGIELTDEQMMFIFRYSQEGVKALEPFRRK